MCTEKNSKKKKEGISCGWCEEMTEAIKGCFPDDAGYSACLARIYNHWGKSCGQKTDKAAKEES